MAYLPEFSKANHALSQFVPDTHLLISLFIVLLCETILKNLQDQIVMANRSGHLTGIDHLP